MKTIIEAHSDLIESSKLHRRTPFAIHPCMGTHFSIARLSGCIKFNGDGYTYFPSTDELIRDDVLRLISKNKVKNKPEKLDQNLS